MFFKICFQSAKKAYDKSGGGVAIGCVAIIFTLLLGAALTFGAMCFQGWIFMLLWNWLAVALFGAETLGFWLCVGIVSALNFIGNLIFGRSGSSKSDD